MAGQVVGNIEPGNTFRIKHVKLWREFFRLIKAAYVKVRLAREFVRFISQWRATVCAETAADAGRGFVNLAFTCSIRHLIRAKANESCYRCASVAAATVTMTMAYPCGLA